jgi:hypothetical protein
MGVGRVMPTARPIRAANGSAHRATGPCRWRIRLRRLGRLRIEPTRGGFSVDLGSGLLPMLCIAAMRLALAFPDLMRTLSDALFSILRFLGLLSLGSSAP